MKQLLHTPEGVRDIYQEECAKKLKIQHMLHHTLHLYGYQDIQTPTFEYFDVFRKEIRTTPSKELYKFFDYEGETLVLRPDMTPQIARFAATLLPDDAIPARLCYMGNTFINHSSYQGRLRETTQMGAEFLGIDSEQADAEMLALVIECLKSTGLEEFQISVGNVDFVQSIFEEAKLSEEKEEHIREALTNRNHFAVDDILKGEKVSLTAKAALTMLSEFAGNREVLEDARKIAPNGKAIKAIKRLEYIYKIMTIYGLEKYISFDLSMSGNYGYYTGIVFRGYTYGSGDAIVKGGRYDNLIGKFGKEMPSIGFVIVVDDLMNALQRQRIPVLLDKKNTIILYDEMRGNAAITLAKEFRGKGKQTEIIRFDEKKDFDFYINYGQKHMASSLLYLQSNHETRMVNLITGEQKILKK